MKKIIKIENLHCAGCALELEDEIRKIKEVEEVTVDFVTQTITLTFKTNVTEVVIYRGGKAETLSVSNKTLAVSLGSGEGVIILPSKLG